MQKWAGKSTLSYTNRRICKKLCLPNILESPDKEGTTSITLCNCASVYCPVFGTDLSRQCQVTVQTGQHHRVCTPFRSVSSRPV